VRLSFGQHAPGELGAKDQMIEHLATAAGSALSPEKGGWLHPSRPFLLQLKLDSVLTDLL